MRVRGTITPHAEGYLWALVILLPHQLGSVRNITVIESHTVSGVLLLELLTGRFAQIFTHVQQAHLIGECEGRTPTRLGTYTRFENGDTDAYLCPELQQGCGYG